VVAKVRQRLAVSGQATWEADVELFNIGKVSELEVRK
jgi:hypothetical protein